jgi:hypothetical protein
MNHENMVNISISLSKAEKKQFEELCNEETRGVTAQFRHMMKFYINNKDKVK